jgi:hypothetical protein
MSIFPDFKRKYGDPIDPKPVREKTLNAFKNKLPDYLLQFWQEDGIGGYMDGMIWTIDPTNYIQYLIRWGDEIVSSGFPILRTAFGDLISWTNITVDIKEDNKIDFSFIALIDIRHQAIKPLGDDCKNFFEINLINKDYFIEETKMELFTQVLEKLGQLKADLCYGYQPLLALGGKEHIDNLKIVNFDIYLDLAMQSIDF